MRLGLSVLFFLLSFSGSLAFAQTWSKEDSIWLKNVLEGKEELIINEDTRKAIEEGRLILPSWMRNNDNNLNFDLLRDFDNGGIPDDSLMMQHIHPFSMPPSVFALYVLYLDKMDSVFNAKSLIITDDERKKLEALLPSGTVHALHFNTHDYSPGFGVNMDFNHLLSLVFSAQYRRIAHNRKHATAYKNYYDNGPAPRNMRITEQERKQLIRSANSYKPPVKISFGQKMNGIDN